MTINDLAEALTREHHDIDAGVDAFVEALDGGEVNAEPLQRAFAALRRHIYLEEEVLFPPIRRAGMMMPILVMTKEHGVIWQLMDALDDLLNADETDVEAVRSTCQQLMAALDQHNAKEEPIVYPRASTDLTAAEATRLGELIETGSTPSGWLCEAVR